jgi:hypothetical protein
MAISPAGLGISLILPHVKHGAGLLQRTVKYASGRLTNSSAWQDVAPYSSRRHSQDCLPERQVKSSRGPCIWPFLSNLRKMTFSSNQKIRCGSG